MEQNRRKDESWHVGKEIPLALLFVLGAQTAGVIWWAATLTATVENNQQSTLEKFESLSYQMADIAANKYTQQDAARDMALIEEKMGGIRQNVGQLKDDITWLKKQK